MALASCRKTGSDNCLQCQVSVNSLTRAGLAGKLPIIPFHGNSNGAANDRVYPI
jgi:hypothetical protein